MKKVQKENKRDEEVASEEGKGDLAGTLRCAGRGGRGSPRGIYEGLPTRDSQLCQGIKVDTRSEVSRTRWTTNQTKLKGGETYGYLDWILRIIAVVFN